MADDATVAATHLDTAGGPAPMELDVVLSPEWLTAALGARHPGVRVASATLVERLETLATKARFAVDYESHGDHDVPSGLCVKGYFGADAARWASLGSREARFYGELAESLPVRVPRCLYAGIDAGTGHGIVVMEDLVAAGATFLTALSPYRPEQVAATLEGLADLHASRWDDADLARQSWLDPTFRGYAGALPDEHLESLLSGPRGDAVPAAVRRPARLKAALGALADRLDGRPSCLVHADAHAGNLYEDSDGRPGFVDWQMYQRTSWCLDVAYHVAAVLEPDERERTQRDLLSHYLDRLRSAGVAAPTFTEAWDDYRAALVYCYFLWAITQRVEPEVTVAFNRRLGTAVAAEGSLELLGV